MSTTPDSTDSPDRAADLTRLIANRRSSLAGEIAAAGHLARVADSPDLAPEVHLAIADAERHLTRAHRAYRDAADAVRKGKR